jgi:2-hydroxy-3-oxopropionate reductase
VKIRVEMSRMRIGFVGLGVMGRPMARNLLKAGYSLVVCKHLDPRPVQELVAAGATEAASPKQVAELSDIVITMLPDSAEVEEVVLGPNGLLEGARRGSVIIDMSSIAPSTSRKLAEEAERRGVEMLDAPVSGGETGAIQGTLAIMVGGKQEIFFKCLKVLQAMGKSIVRVGDAGAGQVAKLANQIIVALNIAAVSEAFALGVKAGVDPRVMYEAIRGGLAGSRVLDAKIPVILERNFKPGFKVRLHHKDLKNALETARELKVPLPMTALIQQVLCALINEGKGEADHSAIVNFFERLANIEVKGDA